MKTSLSKPTKESIISMLEGAIRSLELARSSILFGTGLDAAHREAQDAKEQIITAMMEMEEL